MISLKAKPFYEGMRFRRAHEGEDSIEGECEASECSLLCQDMWKRGYSKIVVDPLVRVFYSPSDMINSEKLTETWNDEKNEDSGNVDQIDWQEKPPKQVFCCPLLKKYAYDPEYSNCGMRELKLP